MDGAGVRRAGVADHRAEGARGEVVRRARRPPWPQHRLRREHDQRRAVRASAWRRSRWKYCAGVDGHGDLHVVLGAQLRGTARCGPRSGRGPGPRSRAAAAARRRTAGPTCPRPDEMNWSMIDLRAVDEVAELRLPQHERVGSRDRVAVLEAEGGVLREQRVVDVELAPGRRRGAASGVYSGRSSRSTRTACRWLNVPRRVSWPASRTGAAVRAAASRTRAPRRCAQSIVAVVDASRRGAASCGASLRVDA